LRDTTVSSVFPDDELRRGLQQLIRLSRILEPHSGASTDASLSEVMALGELADVEAMSQHDLARLLGLEKSTVSRLVAGLVDRGWVSRERNSDNRRLYRLQLTHDGQAAATQIGKELRAQHTELLSGLTQAERQGLAIGLAGIARVLRKHNRQPGMVTDTTNTHNTNNKGE
jgi:DNA-binding MarR family transcriptional regulator